MVTGAHRCSTRLWLWWAIATTRKLSWWTSSRSAGSTTLNKARETAGSLEPLPGDPPPPTRIARRPLCAATLVWCPVLWWDAHYACVAQVMALGR